MEKVNARKRKKADVEAVQQVQYEVSIAGNSMVGSPKMVDPFIKGCLENHLPYLDEWIFSVSKKEWIPEILLEYQKKYPKKIKIVEFDCMGEFVSGKGRIWKKEKL